MGTQLLSPKRGQSPPQFSARVDCGQMAGWIKMSLGRQVGLSQSDIVLAGDPAPPPPKRSRAPNFRPCLFWPDCWMPLGTEVGLGPGHIVLDGDPAPPPPKVHSPKFSAHICCGQMAGWIKMPHGREMGLSPSDIVLDGTQLPSLKAEQPPIFGPCLLWPNG